MPQRTAGGVVLGTGRAKIIVPIMAKTVAEAAAQASALRSADAADLVELRLDPLAAQTPPAALLREAVAAVHAALGGAKPLLATLRTGREGGLCAVPPAEYARLLTALCAADAVRPELLDIEWSAGADAVRALRDAARAAGVLAVFSLHDFEKTPPRAAMAATLEAMGRAGADIAKLAVMPRTAADAAELLAATAEAAAALPDTPLITMSMGALGAITRVCGGAFGSCATFGTAGVSSAPGQPDAAALRAALEAAAPCL